MIKRLIEEMRKFNQHELIVIPHSHELVIKSEYSLFRLGIWLEGYCTAYNTVCGENTFRIVQRSKYCITIGVL